MLCTECDSMTCPYKITIIFRFECLHILCDVLHPAFVIHNFNGQTYFLCTVLTNSNIFI